MHLLDCLAAERGSSRSAVLQQAVSLLRDQQLAQDYADAWTEWDDGDGPLWDSHRGADETGAERGERVFHPRTTTPENTQWQPSPSRNSRTSTHSR